MRYLFRTDYRQDLRLWRHKGDLFWYGLLLLVLVAIPHVPAARTATGSRGPTAWE
jgi:branched-chain amino acid transport system permease protein